MLALASAVSGYYRDCEDSSRFDTNETARVAFLSTMAGHMDNLADTIEVRITHAHSSRVLKNKRNNR